MDENKILDWFHKHWFKCVLGLLCLALGAVFLERSLATRNMNSKRDYILAQRTFEQFRTGQPLPVESIELVENILKRHPELHTRYDAPLAQAFLQQENSTRMPPYASATLERVEKHLPTPYAQFVKTSLLIAEENYPEAYVQTEKLHASLKDAEGVENLKAWNLLRFLFLAKETKNPEKEKEIWKELQTLSAFPLIEVLFREGEVRFADYLSRS